MDSSDVFQLAFMLVLALAVGAGIYVMVLPYFSGEKQADKRLQDVATAKARGSRGKGNANDHNNNRRKQVAETLKELEQRQAKREKVSLRLRLGVRARS